MGSIEKRGKNSYRLTVDVGFGPDGKRIRRRKTVKVKNKREAQKELAKFEAEVLAGEYIEPEKMRFDKFLVEWRKKYAEKKMSPATLQMYNFHIKNRILPAFGHLRLDQIKPMHIVTFLDELQKPGARLDGRGEKLSSGTIEVVYKILRNIFNRAKEWQLIPIHPMKDIKKPKASYTRRGYYDSEEADRVIAALFNEDRMWRLYMLGALLGGFRRGELLALEWKDVDFEKGTLKVDENIPITIKGQAVIRDTKTKASEGYVKMPKWYMEELQKYYHEWKVNKFKVGDKWQGGDREFVFHAGFGKPLYHNSPTSWWIRFCQKHNLKRIRLHDLRHTSAVLLLEENVPLKAIQERLRHASYQTTANTYLHITKKISSEAADVFDKFDPRKRKA